MQRHACMAPHACMQSCQQQHAKAPHGAACSSRRTFLPSGRCPSGPPSAPLCPTDGGPTRWPDAMLDVKVTEMRPALICSGSVTWEARRIGGREVPRERAGPACGCACAAWGACSERVADSWHAWRRRAPHAAACNRMAPHDTACSRVAHRGPRVLRGVCLGEFEAPVAARAVVARGHAEALKRVGAAGLQVALPVANTLVVDLELSLERFFQRRGGVQTRVHAPRVPRKCSAARAPPPLESGSASTPCCLLPGQNQPRRLTPKLIPGIVALGNMWSVMTLISYSRSCRGRFGGARSNVSNGARSAPPVHETTACSSSCTPPNLGEPATCAAAKQQPVLCPGFSACTRTRTSSEMT